MKEHVDDKTQALDRLYEDLGPLGFYFQDLRNSVLSLFSYFTLKEFEDAELALIEEESSSYGHTFIAYKLKGSADIESYRSGCLKKALAGYRNLLTAESLLVAGTKTTRPNTLKESAFACAMCAASHIGHAYFARSIAVDLNMRGKRACSKRGEENFKRHEYRKLNRNNPMALEIEEAIHQLKSAGQSYAPLEIWNKIIERAGCEGSCCPRLTPGPGLNGTRVVLKWFDSRGDLKPLTYSSFEGRLRRMREK